MTVLLMPKRPSKKTKEPNPTGKPGQANSDQRAQQGRRDLDAKAILGKFQGRKSV